MPRTVLLDVDGVLADFASATVAIVNSLFGSAFTVRDVKEWDIARSLNLHPNDAAEMKRAISATPNFARDLPVYPGAIDGVRRLMDVAEVYIVTSPWSSNPTWTHDRERWLLKHFDIGSSRVIHTSAKHVCMGDIFVDDKTDTLERWREVHGRRGGIAAQWQNPHNRLDAWSGPSLGSWDELARWCE